MPLSPGTRLGHYDVTALLGEGGMGQVWQATDTQLNREVALKILPDAFVAEPDRLARFTREAQTLASLNHPNIAAIYGIEESEGTRALVLELVEGPTLADRIAKGPIPLDEALPIAKQIAEALEAAHEPGVIHCDLKPANIKVREDGTVKVLDFGLAKALDPNPQGDPSESPTLTAAATQMGVIMGTAAYMSPEQARGKTVDKRADVWAFGAVMFEMLTGQKPFVGDDVPDTLALVLKFEPEWNSLPPEAPPRIRQLIRACLAKNPKQRVHDVADVRLAMEGVFETTVTAPSEPVAARPLQLWQRPVPAAAVGLALVAITGLVVWNPSRPVAPRPTRFAIGTPSDVRVVNARPTVAPDGRTVAFAGIRDGQEQVYLRALDELDVTPVQGTGGGRPLGVSLDGQSLLVAMREPLRIDKVPLGGGLPVTIAEIYGGFGASWGPDDTIAIGSYSGLRAVPAAGGDPQTLTTLADG